VEDLQELIPESPHKDQGDTLDLVEDDSAPSENHPHLVSLTPMFDRRQSEDETEVIVGLLFSVLTWDKFMIGLVPEDTRVATCVTIANTCNQNFAYMVKSGQVCPFQSDKFLKREIKISQCRSSFSGNISW
jgi:hypothetical protein